MKRILFIICCSILLASCSSKGSTTESHTLIPSREEDNEDVAPFTSHVMKNLLEDFSAILNVSVDENYKIKSYLTKETFFKQFSRIAHPSTSKNYFGYLFSEEEDGLYLLPGETPPFVDLTKDYQLTKDSEKSYRLKQKSDNDLYGPYEVSITFEHLREIDYKLFGM